MSIKVLNEFLPRAEQARLGAVKVGQSLNITEQGTLDVSSYMNVMARTTNVVSEIPYELNISVEDGKFSAKTGTRYSFANSPYNLLPTDRQITADITGERYVCVDSYTNLVLTEAYDTNYSLPIAKISINNGKVVSIDALYPGFGATDNTVFVLPGVSGLIPAGRLANGGLNNQEFKYTEAKKVQVSEDGTYLVGCNDTDLVLLSEDVTYDADLNGNRLNDTPVNYAICGKVVVENGKITEFVSRPTFHALDYYDMDLNYAKREDLGQLAYKDKVSTSDIAVGGIAQSAVTGLITALNNKQDTLTLDDIPKASSSNPVKSSGIYSELAKKQDNLTAGTGIDITNNVISEVSIAYVNYGTGLYADITDLIANKKIILCKYEGRIYQYTAPYTSGSASYYYFTCVDTYNSVKYLRVDQGSNWTNGSQGIQATITGAASTVTSSNLTKNRAVISNASGKIAVSDTTDTELSYVHGVTSNIQTQLNEKVVKNSNIVGSTHTKITYDSKGLVTSGADLTASDIPPITLDKLTDITATANELNVLDGITATTQELNYVDGVTSNIQTQLNSKLDKVSTASDNNRFYAISPTGTQTVLEGEQEGTSANTVTLRTSTGTIRTATPTDNNDATTKKYVDDALAGKQDSLNPGNGIEIDANNNINIIQKGTSYSVFGALKDEAGILSQFNSSNFALLSVLFPDTFNKAKIILHAQTGTIYANWQTLLCDTYSTKLLISSETGIPKFYISSNTVLSSTPLSANTWYWFCVDDDGTNATYYAIQDNNYTLNTLPSLSSWTAYSKITHEDFVNAFKNTSLQVGKDFWTDAWTGKIDLKQSQITINDTEAWKYEISDAQPALATLDKYGLVKPDGVTININNGLITFKNTPGYITANSPALNGTPTAPTAAKGTNNKQIANTEYVRNELADYVVKNNNITAGTHTKITYDAKGLVTAGTDIKLSDVTDITASASEVNVLDGITTSTTELNYVKGVTSSIQTQLNNKQATISDLATIRSGATAGSTALQPSDVIDNVTSTATDQPLSANQGKILQEQIDDLKSIGRFLSIWNCKIGKPTSEPESLPYTYHTGDYFLVGEVNESGTNYRPAGSSYTGAASTVVETEVVKVADMYYYDGTTWQLSQNSQRTVSFADIAGQPTDNTNLSNALNNKVTKNNAITGATHTKITYDSKGLVTGGSDLTTSDIPSLPVSKLTGVTATASELNVLDGIDTTTTALNYTKDVTSPIQAQIDTKLNYADYGLIVPDTTNMKVLKTYEYDISNTSVYTFCKFKNDKSNLADLTGDAIFRITITGTNINQNIEGIISVRQAVESPYIVIRNRRGSSSTATTGIRSIHTCYPKALNNGYDWLIELSAYNATPRHIKIEVLKSDTGFEWLDTATLTTYNSTYQTRASITAYTIDGIIGYPNLYWNVNSASSAGYISSYLPKLIPGTMPKTGEATLASQFVFMSGNLIYPATNKTKAIDPGFGIVYSSTAVANNTTYTYTYLRQKGTVSSLTNIPHATLATGNKVWFRCHLDNSGNIISDNYVDTEMRPGYTWYYIGVASSARALMLDLTSSIFLTLDTEGNLTHINGKKITSTDLLNYAPLKSPALTGIPTTPTAAKGTNNKQIANTEYVRNELADYVVKNADIAGATHTKITYDAKGLVTAGSDITLADVTDITATTTEVNYLSGVTSNVQTQLNNKANSSQLSNYQLLITSSNKLSADLLSEGSNNKLVSQAEKSTWNAKQNALTAGTNINITNNTISTNAAQVIIRRYS